MAEPSQKQGDPTLPGAKGPSAGTVDSVADEGDTAQSDSDDNDAEDDEDDEEDDDEDDDDGEEEEPKLKYARLTSFLAPVYRNGDATSAFLVAGDKMVGHSRQHHSDFH